MDFHTDPSGAIAQSLERKVPLFVLIDGGDARTWFDARFADPPTAEFLVNNVVRLQIQYKSSDYANLAQFAPSLEELGSTGALVLFSGMVLALFPHQMDPQSALATMSEMRAKFAVETTARSEEAPVGASPVQPIGRTPALAKTPVSKLIKAERKAERKPKMPIPASKQPPKARPTSCTLQLKLLDGTSIRHSFLPSQKLHTVREFVLEACPEYNNHHFYFFKPIERVTLGEGDELRSLEDLDLNMSTLIVKVVDPQDAPEPIEASPSNSPFRWVKSTWAALWSPPPEEQPPSAATTDIMMEDDESDAASFHSALTPPLRPSMSSFTLYGSQGIISSSQSLRSLGGQRSERGDRSDRTDWDPAGSSSSTGPPADPTPSLGNGNNVSLQGPSP